MDSAGAAPSLDLRLPAAIPNDAGAGNTPGEPLRALVALAQQQARSRADLPDTHVALLLLSMGVMPQLAQTALGAGLDAAELDVDAASLTLRHLAVLQAGVVRSANPLPRVRARTPRRSRTSRSRAHRACAPLRRAPRCTRPASSFGLTLRSGAHDALHRRADLAYAA